jgi:outer membrane protein
MLKKLVLSTALILSLSSTASFAADAAQPTAFKAGDLLVRARMLGVLPQEDSTISAVGGSAELTNSIVPELDFTYFLTSNIAAELILATTPHSVDVKGSSVGSVDAGNVWLLPPTLLAQYHFTNFDSFKPYVGAGINYTFFYNDDSGALNNVTYKDNFGYALQAGVDVPIEGNWYFNADIKKIYLNTDAKFNNGTIVADVDIDPVIFGLGIGYKF